jgi:hypothetical protein
MNMKKFALALVCSPLLLLLAEPAHAQAVSQSPNSLSFGIPTGTAVISPATLPASAPQTVTVTIASGSVTFSNPSATISGANSAQYAITGNSCAGALTGPTSCQVAVTFYSNSASLQTAVLNITGSGFELPGVPLSGAYGAIKLFDEVNVEPSNAGVTLSNPFTYGSTGLNLSCPGSIPALAALASGPITAHLSSSPDGAGYVLEDNYLTLAIGGTAANTGFYPAGNVCSGGPADNNDGTFLNDCFTTNYQVPAGQGSLIGENPDTFANPGNPVLAQQTGNENNAGGLPPIDISSFFSPGPVQPTISLLDGGGYVAGASLFLVTNCTLAGIAPGGSITGNPITSGNTASQTQTFTFDSVPGQNISFTTSEAVAITQGTAGAPTGQVPTVTNFGISQEAFSALITGTSAAPAVCLRLTGELDPHTGETLCKAFELLCYDPTTKTTSGDSCVTPTNVPNARYLYDSAQFTSPDAPAGVNFLQSSCANFMLTEGINNGTCAASSSPGTNPTTLIGPGFLLGSDTWLAGNCSFAGTLTGDLCPLDTLTQFRGAADPLPGGTTGGRNTIYVPVVNKPLPFTHTTIMGEMNGWVDTNNVTVNFVSNEATYNPTGTNPPANNFMSAPPYSLTYGIASASVPVPDTTYPVPGDTTNYNDPYVTHNFGAPLCQAGTPASFNSSASFENLADGFYNLHYYTTDCALTEELLFNPSAPQLSDPTANWASFPTLLFGVDTQAPSISHSFSAAGNTFLIGQNVQITYKCADVGSGIAKCNGKVPASCPIAPAANPTLYSFANSIDTTPSAFGSHSFAVLAMDCAGNTGQDMVSYTVAAPAADVAIFEGRSSDYVAPGGILTYVVWALDFGFAPAYGVTINASVPPQYVQGNLSGTADIVSCNLSGACTDVLVGKACTPVAAGQLSCNIGPLPSLFTLKGAKVKIKVPISPSVPSGAIFKINASVSSDNDPNPKNNSTSDTITVVSPN